jgi:hypothetical protein
MQHLVFVGRTPLLTGGFSFGVSDRQVLVDLRKLEFATPFDLVGLAAMIYSVPADCEIEVLAPDDAAVATYLCQMSFFDVVGAKRRSPRYGWIRLLHLRRH